MKMDMIQGGSLYSEPLFDVFCLLWEQNSSKEINLTRLRWWMRIEVLEEEW